MTYRNLTLAFLAASLACVGTTLAHAGPRLFLGSDAGRVSTYLGNNNELSTTFAPDRVFTTTLSNAISPTLYTNSFPGYQVAEGRGVTTGTTFSLSVAGPLLYFDGYAAGTGTYRTTVDAFSGGAAPQLAVSKGTASRVTSTGPLAPLDVLTYNAAGDHGHAAYTLFGDGATASDGPAGVYALPLTMSGTGLSASLPFYLLLGKDVALGSPEIIEAERVARATLVPEPTSVAAIAAVGLIATRRRRRARAL